MQAFLHLLTFTELKRAQLHISLSLPCWPYQHEQYTIRKMKKTLYNIALSAFPSTIQTQITKLMYVLHLKI